MKIQLATRDKELIGEALRLAAARCRDGTHPARAEAAEYAEALADWIEKSFMVEVTPCPGLGIMAPRQALLAAAARRKARGAA